MHGENMTMMVINIDHKDWQVQFGGSCGELDSFVVIFWDVGPLTTKSGSSCNCDYPGQWCLWWCNGVSRHSNRRS